VGLAEQWGEIRERYREVNFALGDIIKVTPSSKVVGDFALWLVRNNLTVQQFMDSAQHYDLPQSVIDLCKGAIGVPEGGFPEALRRRILGPDAPPLPEGPMMALLPPFDFEAARAELEGLSERKVQDSLVVSYALYPKVIKDYLEHLKQYGDTSVLDTETFLYGLGADREIFIDIEPGKALVVQRTAVGELREDKTRQVFFMINGQPRSAVVFDKSAGGSQSSRRKASPNAPGEVGAPMPGSVSALRVKAGQRVEENQPLCVLEAMKLETTVRAPFAGEVAEVFVKQGERVQGGELLMLVVKPS
jgi:pyruvate carboxylase